MSRGAVYSGLWVPRKAGVKGLSLLTVYVLGGGAVAAALCVLLLSQLGAAVALIAVAIVVAAVVETGGREGRTRVERGVSKVLWRRRKDRRYVSGVASHVPDGSSRAPGLLAATMLIEAVDDFGNRFGVLWHRASGTVTVFWSVSGAGTGLRDQADTDVLVNDWAAALRDYGTTAALVQVAVTTESGGEDELRLRQAVEASREQQSDRFRIPAAASTGVDEIVAATSSREPRVEQRIAATFEQQGATADEFVQQLVGVLPLMQENLQYASGAVVSLMEPEHVTDAFFVGYHPDRASAVEEARLAGGTGLSWEEIGPSTATTHETFYEHAGVTSQTLQVWQPPRGVFRDRALAALLSPDRSVLRKRVTLIYRVLGPEQSATVLDQHRKAALFETSQSGQQVSSRADLRLENARTADEEQAAGAAVVRLSILVTVTTRRSEQLKEAVSRVRQACSSGVVMRIRDSHGSEDASFAMALGAGLVAGKFATLPKWMLQAMRSSKWD